MAEEPRKRFRFQGSAYTYARKAARLDKDCSRSAPSPWDAAAYNGASRSIIHLHPKVVRASGQSPAGYNGASRSTIHLHPKVVRASGESPAASLANTSHHLRFVSADKREDESKRDDEFEGADWSWYDGEEFATYSTPFLGEECTFSKGEQDLAKNLRHHGTTTLQSQSRRVSQARADNARWEDAQLLRSGAVRGSQVRNEMENEEEVPVILLVHDTKPPFLDGTLVYTRQADPVMPVKDPTSDMALISKRGSALVQRIHEKQNLSKSRQRFWELAGTRLGGILGAERTVEQVHADKVVEDKGELSYKENVKFALHLEEKGEAASEFARTKTIAEQRQCLPIFSVRYELLQVNT